MRQDEINNLKNMLISSLPEPIKQLALNEQERAGNKRDETKDLLTLHSFGGFNWDTSLDGFRFWTQIEQGNFAPFIMKNIRNNQPNPL